MLIRVRVYIGIYYCIYVIYIHTDILTGDRRRPWEPDRQLVSVYM